MGNNCVASGGTPHKADITIVNNTKYELVLDHSVDCGRECGHQGWQILEGKIVEGFTPPENVKPYTSQGFSVSGREGSAVAPKGKVFYANIDLNLKVMFEWSACGWTSQLSSGSSAIAITGIRPSSGLRSSTPWDQKLVGESDHTSWIYTIRPREGHLSEVQRTARKMDNIKIGMN